MIPTLLPKSLDERFLLACVVLGLMLAAAGAKILRLQEQLAARPAVEEHQATRVVTGPTRTVYRTITAPGGTVTVEKERTVESRVVETVRDHSETPVALPHNRTRYVGLGIDPLRYAALPRLRAGVTFFGAVDLGVSYDARFSPTGGAFGVEAAYRF